MRVLWGFQILLAETVNWNLSEESDLAFRAAILSVEIKRDFENIFSFVVGARIISCFNNISDETSE